MFAQSGVGALQRRGATNYVNGSLPSGTTVILSAAANTTGVIVRTLFATAGSTYALVGIDGANFIGISASGTSAVNYFGPGILLPPGSELTVNSGGGGAQIGVTWDVQP